MGFILSGSVQGVGCSTAPACGPRLEEASPVQKQQSPMLPRELLLIRPESDTAGEIARCAPFSKMVVVCPSEMEAAIKVTADGGPLPAGGPDALRPPVLCPRG